MAFVAAATSVGAAVLGTGAAAGIGSTIVGGALLGAGAGGLYSAITGDGNILNSMLTGGLIGGAGAGIGGSMFPGAAGIQPASLAAPSTAAVPTSNVLTGTAATNQALINSAINPATGLPFAETSLAGSSAASQEIANAAAQEGLKQTGSGMGMKALGYGLAGSAALSLLGNKPTSAGAPPQPGMIRPYQYAANPTEATGEYPAPYATTQYNTAGLPILDTRERKYFSPSFTALPPYQAAKGGLMYAYGGPVERMSAMDQQRGMYPQGMIDKTEYATPTQRPASMEIVRSDYDTPVNPITGLQPMGMAGGGDTEEEVNKRIMKNIRGASTKELEQIMKSMDEQEFLRRNMPNYAEAMRPSISGMVEGAQYGDRMAQSFGATPRDVMVMPTVVDPQSKTFGGIASIGQQLDPDTRLRMMADIQRTPFDRSSLEAVRRVGAGLDRRIGKDASLSAFYEQDPMGRNKMGGARFTQRFAQGGSSDEYNLGSYSDGGRLLKGPGDGVSDDIPAMIGKKQPARLADGEFVIPARIVSELGNGSTDAGARRLYAMMDRIQSKRQKSAKKGKFAINTKAEKELPA
jgi:hypothetical protein